MSHSKSSEVPHIPLQRFLIRGGVVESDSPQDVVDNYAADFQGLRHFGQKVGEALNLGEPWSVSLREAQFTLNYAEIEENLGAGALIGQRDSLATLLTEVSEADAE
tara:strand:- start:547 stop:864 length:318 start_codon:yes stop_codon:yes gene_type:complete